MDLLRFGMEHEKGSSVLERTAARAALRLAKRRADIYQRYLEKKHFSIPNHEEVIKNRLERIKKQIEEQSVNKTADTTEPEKVLSSPSSYSEKNCDKGKKR